MVKETFLKVRSINEHIKQLPGICKPTEAICFESTIIDDELKKLVGKLYADGHYTRAVEEAFKFVNNLVKNNAGLDSALDGAKLMNYVLNANNPILKLNACLTQSELDEQLGYMQICAGCMTGIRNPRAHEHKIRDSKHKALQFLILADHLIEKIKMATCTNALK